MDYIIKLKLNRLCNYFLFVCRNSGVSNPSSKTEQVNAEGDTVTVTSGREKRKRNKPPPSYAEIQSSEELLTGNHDSDCDDNLYSEGEDSEKEDCSQDFFDDSLTESPPKKKRKGRIG